MVSNKIQVVITDHAYERAKQRLDTNLDKHSLLFRTHLLDLFRKCTITYHENEYLNYVLYQNQQKIIFKTKINPHKIIIVTIIVQPLKV